MDKGGKCVHRDRTSLFWLYPAPMKNNNCGAQRMCLPCGWRNVRGGRLDWETGLEEDAVNRRVELLW
jgi:hypothetical protein